ncbi:hypothetical protein AC579_9325 [Pseudocercospora musae]|uniref:Uncharacterized protein n=1 Tax=Pseudocercospora musae TaxID=113226 RepID=A0A139I4X1_9PEZI|nr:hypothetical protein AC579_9325 [Pseudocercospora musae]
MPPDVVPPPAVAVRYLQLTDVSWDNPLAAIYSSMEVNIGIMCLDSQRKCSQDSHSATSHGHDRDQPQLEASPSPRSKSFHALGGREKEATAKIWLGDVKCDANHIDIDEENPSVIEYLLPQHVILRSAHTFGQPRRYV